MQIRREELGKLAAKYQEKADRAFQNYQETGISRYDRERRNAGARAEALRAAANAAEEHQMLAPLKAEFVWWASRADEALAENAPREKLAEILEGIVTSAAVFCKYKRRERKTDDAS